MKRLLHRGETENTGKFVIYSGLNYFGTIFARAHTHIASPKTRKINKKYNITIYNQQYLFVESESCILFLFKIFESSHPDFPDYEWKLSGRISGFRIFQYEKTNYKLIKLT
jgi:hypothetical protein